MWRNMLPRPLIVYSGLVGAFVLPHGPSLVDKEISSQNRDIKKVIQSMHTAADIIQNELKPDIILLTTPHGIKSSEHHSIYLNKTASGTAEWYNKYKDVEIDIEINIKKSENLLNWIKSSHLLSDSIGGIGAFYPGYPLPLKWGEVIPLYFIKQYLSNTNCQCIILSTRDYMKESELSSMNQINCDQKDRKDCDELRLLGENILNWIENIDEKVVVIVSGDGAHSHKCQQEQPYVYSKNAVIFDSLIDQWIIHKNGQYLDEASYLLYDALSCGFYGYLILDGMLNRWRRLNGSNAVNSALICESVHSSYFSMLVASFQFE